MTATPVKAEVAFGFPMKNVSRMEPFTGMLGAPLPFGLANGFRVLNADGSSPNTFWIVGGDKTVRLALEVLPLPASMEVTVTLLFCVPVVTPVTFSEMVHDVLAARVAPDKLTEVPPSTADVYKRQNCR